MAKSRSLKLGFILIIILILGIAIYSGSFYWAEHPTLQERDLVITRVIVKDAERESKLGQKSDWLEIKNTTDRELHLKEGEWYITDKAFDQPYRFPLPELFIQPDQKVRIWCDGQDMHGTEIHTNFKLDSDGEQVAIFVVDENQKITPIDVFHYGKTGENRGYERKGEESKPIN